MKKKSNGSTQNVLTHELAVPLNGATTAKFDINAGTGNLTIDTQTSDVHVLANGTLEFVEKQGPPVMSTSTNEGQAAFSLKASGPGRPSFRLPWAACNGETAWSIHLNPAVQSEITAHSDGGNIRVDLTGMNLTHVSADTGGGNMELILPDNFVDLNVLARTGAGNVDVQVPGRIKAKIHATTGLGKVVMDPRFEMLDKNTYQSPDFDAAASKLELTVSSGAGNVSVSTKV